MNVPWVVLGLVLTWHMVVVLGCGSRRDSEQMIADVGVRYANERAGRPATTGAALRPRLSRRSR